jgi:hypothetical protein
MSRNGHHRNPLPQVDWISDKVNAFEAKRSEIIQMVSFHLIKLEMQGTWRLIAKMNASREVPDGFWCEGLADIGEQDKALWITVHKKGAKGVCAKCLLFPPDFLGAEAAKVKFQEYAKTCMLRNKASNATVGQMYNAEVIERLDYGLRVHVDAIDCDSVIPLDQISGSYDKNELNRSAYAIGKNVRARVIDQGPPLKMSLLAITEEDVGLFSGKPDKTGELKLFGFSKDIGQCVKVLNWLAVLSLEHNLGSFTMPEAVDCIRNELMKEYGATIIPGKSIVPIISGLRKKEWITIEPGKAYSDPSNITIAEKAWNDELGGIDCWRDALTTSSAPVVEEEAPVGSSTVEVLDHIARQLDEETKVHDPDRKVVLTIEQAKWVMAAIANYIVLADIHRRADCAASWVGEHMGVLAALDRTITKQIV